MTAETVTRRAFLAFRLGAAPGTPAVAADTPDADTPDIVDDPFASYDIACAQVNEARPFLADEARRYGISMENRSDLDILREIFAKATPPTD